MKRTRLVALVVAAALALGIGWMAHRQITPNVGRYLAGADGSHLVVLDGSPIVMASENEAQFQGLSDGDLILIFNDGIETSFPGRTGVYACLRLASGNAADIPSETLEALRQMGWLD